MICRGEGQLLAQGRYGSAHNFLATEQRSRDARLLWRRELSAPWSWRWRDENQAMTALQGPKAFRRGTVTCGFYQRARPGPGRVVRKPETKRRRQTEPRRISPGVGPLREQAIQAIRSSSPRPSGPSPTRSLIPHRPPRRRTLVTSVAATALFGKGQMAHSQTTASKNPLLNGSRSASHC